MLQSLARLVVEIRERIPQYDTVISDEASGRLPALLLYKIINQKRAEEEKPAARIRFVSAGYFRKKAGDMGGPQANRATEKFFRKNKDILSGRTLLVSEYIQSGKSILSLVKILERTGANFDLAVVSCRKPEAYDRAIRKRLFYGQIGGVGAAFYNRHNLTGVVKGRGVHPERAPGPNFDVPVDPQVKKKVREEIDIVAGELAKLVE